MEDLLTHLAALEARRGHPVLLYATTIADDSVRMVYEWLRRRGHLAELSLVLSTTGGIVTRARQLALLLREYAERLTILVPYRAWSAGTLLCLAADELLLAPLAELGPIDAHIGATGAPPPDAPGLISAQEIRAFRQMAQRWFGVERAEDRLQVLALAAQRIFPATLSAFYRFDQLTREIGYELLAYQLPAADAATRRQIVDRLADGYHAHEYIISRSDARALGLNVRFAAAEDETLLWNVELACRAQLAADQAGGLIVGGDFVARQVLRRLDGAPLHDPPPGGFQPGLIEPQWQIEIVGDRS